MTCRKGLRWYAGARIVYLMSKPSGFEKGAKAMAQRMDQAEDSFVETLMTLGGITLTEAKVVFAGYRKFKLVKMDAVGGRITVKHGALLDREVIRRAAQDPA